MSNEDINIRKLSEKILVVSDNQELTLFFQKVIGSLSFEHPLQIDYRYSSVNKNPKPMIDIGSEEINIKDPRIVDFLIKQYDLVLSVHCKQIFPSKLIQNVCCINFHPGFNPYNRGWYPQAFSVLNGFPVGATIHVMDEDIDHGWIIEQEEVKIEMQDTSFEIYRKIIEIEKKLMSKNLYSIVEGLYDTYQPSHEGNYNGVKDYRDLCMLDLSSVGTLGEHIDLLRATTHASFKNAYYLDAVGNKYYVRISIEQEPYQRDKQNDSMVITRQNDLIKENL